MPGDYACAGVGFDLDRRIRALVADDEPVARQRVTSLLRAEPDIDVVSECASVEETRVAIEVERPDLIFLDVRMPRASGLDLVHALDRPTAPAIVVVTASDRHALRAFEVHALDYVLKPFSAERFRAALRHAREYLSRCSAPAASTGSVLPRAGSSRARGHRDRLVLRSAGRVQFVRTKEIDWCEQAGERVRVHASGQQYVVRGTLSQLEPQLDGLQFLRISGSTIVNVDRILEMQPSFNGEYVVLLRSGARLTLGRGYFDALQERIGQTL